MNVKEVDDAKNRIFNYLLVQSIYLTVLLIPSIFLLKSQPPTPPCFSAKVGALSPKESLPKLLKNRNYVILLVSFGLFFGNIQGLSPNTAPMAALEGFSASQVSILFGCVVLMSVIGSIVLGKIVALTKRFKLTMLTAEFVVLATWVATIWIFDPEIYGLTLTLIMIYGFFSLSM